MAIAMPRTATSSFRPSSPADHISLAPNLARTREQDAAAVHRLTADRALMTTLDFFMPIVIDSCGFGRIAAAKALSDIFPMRARPCYARSTSVHSTALTG